MNKYTVILTLEIDECSIEATSSSEAESFLIEDIKSRLHKDANIKVISLSSEQE